MNNVINMVNYYVEHKNADDSVVEYIKNKLESSDLTELIIIQIELLYTDPSDKLVSGLVNFITDKINNILTNINLYNLAITINHLKREEYFKYSDFAVLYRMNTQSRAIEDILRRENIPYKIVGVLKFY